MTMIMMTIITMLMVMMIVMMMCMIKMMMMMLTMIMDVMMMMLMMMTNLMMMIMMTVMTTYETRRTTPPGCGFFGGFLTTPYTDRENKTSFCIQNFYINP